MAYHPLSFQIIAVPANREVARYQERHGAIIQRPQVLYWLDAKVPKYKRLDTPPARSFAVEEITAGGARGLTKWP